MTTNNKDTLLSVRAAKDGARLLLEIETNSEDKPVRELLQIYAKDKPPHLQKGEISPETVAKLRELHAFCGAMDMALRMLSFGSCSARHLADKLCAKRIPRELARKVVSRVCEMGFLAEDDAAKREAERGAQKLWGNRRIAMELAAKGYGRAAVSAAMASLADDDEEARCLHLLQKRYARAPVEEEPRRLTAALYRYGYGEDIARHAIERFKNEE